jgi:hypothetical protein
MLGDGRRGHQRGSLVWWLLFDYLLPVFFIVIFWPVAVYLMKLPYAFERVFHGADLIPVASILILGAIRELDTKRRLGLIGDEAENWRSLALFVSIILLVVYAILRFHVMRYDFPANAEVPIDETITGIARVSLWVVVSAGAFCFWLKSLTLRAERFRG